jgi:hypothetical protein
MSALWRMVEGRSGRFVFRIGLVLLAPSRAFSEARLTITEL